MRKILIILTLSLLISPTAFAAEYLGQNIDHQLFDATAYSYGTSKFYHVMVEFSGDEALIHFSNGGRLVLTLDDEEIDDPNNISAYDYRRSTFWDLDVDGIY